MQQIFLWSLLLFVFLADIALALVHANLPSTRAVSPSQPGSRPAPAEITRISRFRGGLLVLFFILLAMAYFGINRISQTNQVAVSTAILFTVYILFAAWIFLDASQAIGQDCPRSEKTRLRRRLFWLFSAMNAFLLVGLGLLLTEGMPAPAPINWNLLFSFMALDGVKIALVFIALLGVYPLAFIAYRQVYSTLHQERLEEEFKLLGIYTEDEARRKVRELYGIAYSLRQYLWFILLIILYSTLILLVFAFIDQMGKIDLARIGMNGEVRTLIFYAYLGAYVFSVQELIRRYNTEDLRPQVFSSILGRMLVATVVVFVGAQVLISNPAYQATQAVTAQVVATVSPQAEDIQVTPSPEDPVAPGSPDQAGQPAAQQPPIAPPLWAAVLAFFIGIFPQSGIQWLQNLARNSLNTLPSETNLLPLRNLQGVSLLHAARLEEMGIDDVQNLATADIRKLLLITRFDTHQIINWIDQAILYSKVGAKYQNFKDENIYSIYQLITRIRQLEAERVAFKAENPGGTPPDELNLLATRLKISMAGEMQSLINPFDYPNFAYIRAYYRHAPALAADRAEQGRRGLSDYLEDPASDITEEYRARVEEYQELVKVDPADFEAWFSLGMFLSKLDNRWEEAYRALSRAAELNPNSANTFANLAVACYQLGEKKWDEAVQNATRAIAINPKDKFSYLWRGKTYLAQLNHSKAEADFDQAISIDDHYGEAYLKRGIVYNALKNFKKALEDFDRAYWLISDRRDSTLWSEWGMAHLSLGDIHESAATGSGEPDYRMAVEKFTEAISIHSDPEIYFSRGLAYRNLRQWDKAIANFAKSIHLYHLINDSKEFKVHYHLGLALWLSDRMSDACAEFHIVIQNLAPGDSEVTESKKYLEKDPCRAAAPTSPPDAPVTAVPADQPSIKQPEEPPAESPLETPAAPPQHAAILKNLARLGLKVIAHELVDRYIDYVLGEATKPMPPEKLASMGEELQLPPETVSQADLMTLPGMQDAPAALLAQAGVRSVKDLAGRDPAELHAALASANAAARLLEPDPDIQQVSAWIEQSKSVSP